MERCASSVVVAASLALVVVTACLGSIPEASRCPATAVYAPCPQAAGPPAPSPGPPPPGPGIAPCAAATDACLRGQRADCACRPEVECKRGSGTCYPPPDCPRSVTDAHGGATCLDATASLVPVGPEAPPCQCGCTSCAVACDGRGPVLGGNQVVRFDLPSTARPTERVGAMVRLRGSGHVALVGRTADGAIGPMGEASAAPADFSEIVVTAGEAAAAARPPLVAIELRTEAVANVEVDCVVPFYAR